MNFNNLISRADDEALQSLIGKAEIRLLRMIDQSLVLPSNLKKVLLDIHSREDLLISPSSRSLLMDLLRPEEALTLAEVLGLSDKDGVYRILKNTRIRRRSEREKILFNFFGLIPPHDDTNELAKTQLMETEYGLFEHQRVAARKVADKLDEGPRRVLLHMPTGSGKTRTAMHVIANHLRKHEPTIVVWLAYSEELCDQAVTEFERAWQRLGDREISVFRFWGSVTQDIDTINDGFMVAGLSKTYNKAKQSISFISKLAKKSSLVIIDEAHQAVAESYKLILDTLVIAHDSTALLGLSATPGRSWLEIDVDQQLADFFARNKVTLQIPGYANPIDYLVDEGYLAKTEFKSLMSSGNLTLSLKDLKRIEAELDLPFYILQRLGASEQRNLAIVTEVKRLLTRHRCILVFATSVQHAKLLATVFSAQGIRAEYVDATTNPFRRARIINEFKKENKSPMVLCNYGVLAAGFDAPKTSAAVIARPTKSLVLYSQMVGRATRGVKAGGNETAEIVTVVDIELPGFRNLIEAFYNWEDVWR